jgi:hypothetical protein
MKRLLFVLLALACVSTLSFGQGVFHAWNLGEYIVAGQLQEGPIGAGWGPAWDKAGGLDQEWTFAYDGKNFGFDATLEFGSADFANVSAGGGIAQPGGWQPITWFGTYYKFGDYAKLYIGMPRDNDYSLLSYINNIPLEQRLMDSQWGANLQVFPIAGLSVMLTGFQPPSAEWATPTGTGFLTGTLNFGDNFAAGAKYTMKDVFTALVYYKAIQYNNAGAASYQTYGPHDNVNILNMKYIHAALEYVGIKDLSLQAGLAYDFSSQGDVAEPQFVSVYLGAMTSKVRNMDLAAQFYLKSVASDYTVFTVDASGQYNFPNSGGWGVGAQIGYDLGAGASRWNGWTNGMTPLSAYNGAGLFLEPFVVYNVPGGYVKLGFVYVSGGPDFSTAGHPSTKQSWGIPISYNWSF